MAQQQPQQQERALTIKLVRERCLSPEQQQLPPEEIADLLLEHSSLDLHHAGITTMQELYAFSHIQSLSLSHNSISDMSPVVALVKCKIIRLDHNRIERVRGVDMLHKLIELDLRHNTIMVADEGLSLPPQLRKLLLTGNPLFPGSNNVNEEENEDSEGKDSVRDNLYADKLAELERAVCARCPNIHIDVCSTARPDSVRPDTAPSRDRSLRDSLLAKVSSQSQVPLPQPVSASPAALAPLESESEKGGVAKEHEDLAQAQPPALQAPSLAQCSREMDRMGDEELQAFRQHRQQASKAAHGAADGEASERVLKAREYLQLRREQLRREVEEYEQATKLRVDAWQQRQAEQLQRSETAGSGPSHSTHVQENTPR